MEGFLWMAIGVTYQKQNSLYHVPYKIVVVDQINLLLSENN
jgi:hypothetical protein